MLSNGSGCKQLLPSPMMLSPWWAPEGSPSVTSEDLPGEGPGSPTYTETDKQ